MQRDFFSLECKYCGSALQVVMPDVPPAYIIDNKQQRREVRFKIDRYLKENKQPLTKSNFILRQVYYPYWKIDAARLQIRQEKIENKNGQTSNPFTTNIQYGGNFQWGRALGSALTSQATSEPEIKTHVNLVPYLTTIAAAEHIEGIPHSIGMRAEYIRVKPLTGAEAALQAEFIPVNITWNQVCATMNKTVEMRGRVYSAGKVNKSQIFHPEGSIVYFPYIIAEAEGIGQAHRFVLDGITGRIISTSLKEEISTDAVEPVPPTMNHGNLTVKLHRCRNCGVDLPAGKSSVYICHNCHQAVSIDKDYPLQNGIMLATCDKKIASQDVYFPFWSFELSEQIIVQLVKRATIDGPGNKLIIPAFKLSSFDVLRKLSGRITAYGNKLQFEPLFELLRNYYPTTLGLSEALIMAEVVLYCSQAKANPNMSADGFKIAPDNVTLFYAPFHPENYFYVDSIGNAVTFEKGVVSQ